MIIKNDVKMVSVNDGSIHIFTDSGICYSRELNDSSKVVPDIKKMGNILGMASSKLFTFAFNGDSDIFELKDDYFYKIGENFSVYLREIRKKIVDIKANDNGIVYLRDDGFVYSYTDSDDKSKYPVKIDTGIEKIAINNRYILTYGKKKGVNLFEVVGNEINTSNKGLSFTTGISYGYLKNLKDLSLSNTHGIFLTDENELFLIGQRNGAILLNDEKNSLSKVRKTEEMVVPEGVIISKVFAGEGRTFIISEDGEIFATGNNLNGELGVFTKKLVQSDFIKIPNFKGIDDIICNHSEITFFKTKLGNLYASGDLTLIGKDITSTSPILIDYL